MDAKWNRILNIFALCLWTFDYTTDILTLRIYWREQSLTIAVLSTVVTTITGLISCALVPGLLHLIWRGKDHNKKEIFYLQYATAMFGSLPQLCINLYILGVCGQNIHTMQYISGVASLLGAFLGVVIGGDKAYGCDIEDKDIPMVHILSLFIAKATTLIVRVFIFVCYTYYEGGWALMLICGHILILIPCGILKLQNEWKPRGNFKAVIKVIFLGVGFLFVWFGDLCDKRLTMSWMTLFFLENISFAISLYAKLYTFQFCLPHIFWVNIGLVLTGLIFACINVYGVRYHQRLVKKAAWENKKGNLNAVYNNEVIDSCQV